VEGGVHLITAADALAGAAEPQAVRRLNAMKHLTLSRSQQLYIFFIVCAVLPIIVGIAFLPQLYEVYLEQFARPQLEREFGFKAGQLRIPGDYDCLAIVSVSPGGIFARAGVKAGDLPVGYQHRVVTEFYSDLKAVQDGRAVEFRVVASDEYRKGREAWRRIRIEPAVAR